MEDDKKIQNGRRPTKKVKMEDDQKFKMEDDQNIQNGRRPKKFKMEDDQKNSEWKTTKILKCSNNDDTI